MRAVTYGAVVLMIGLAAAPPAHGSPIGLSMLQTSAAAALVQEPATPAQAPPAQDPPVQNPLVPPPQDPALPGVVSPPRTADTLPPAKARYFVQVMEGILERAVRYAAGQMNTKLQAVSPELLQLSGAARARGFRLDGYGVFFDVEVPAALRQTMGWTARLMQQQNDQTLDQALNSLRQLTSALDGKRRVDADTALKLLELRARPTYSRSNLYAASTNQMLPAQVQATSTGQAGPVAGDASTPNPGGPSAPQPNQPPAPTPEDLAWMRNPDAAYEMEVRDALIGAMLGYGSTLALRPDEWLTVAARDNQTVVVPGDLTETVTVILRIKGSDLAEFTAGRLSEADVRRRVEVREF